MPRILIAGYGFVGSRAAELFCKEGWDVFGLTRTKESAHELSSTPCRVLACDISDRKAVEALREFSPFDAIVNCVSSGHGGVEIYRRVYFEGTKNLIELLAPRKFVFTSSTSVYAQTDGSWVTEESDAKPLSETSKVLRATETLALSCGGIVARLAGIYGPGRSVLVRKFIDGEARIKGGGNKYLNQIHRDDAAAALHFLITRLVPGGIYNVTDDSPTMQTDYYRWLSEMSGKPMPPTDPIATNLKRGWSNKRVSNRKLRASGWTCQYPSPRDALIGGLEIIGQP